MEQGISNDEVCNEVGWALPTNHVVVCGAHPTWYLLVFIVVVLHSGLVESALAAGPRRALPPGEIPADTRLGPLKGERGDFSFVPARSRYEWSRRAE